jgi:formamidase
MIDHLVLNHGLTREEAYVLCSVVADLKISELVDMPNFLVSCYMPLNIFR